MRVAELPAGEWEGVSPQVGLIVVIDGMEWTRKEHKMRDSRILREKRKIQLTQKRKTEKVMEERDESLGGKRWKKKIAGRDGERVTGMRRSKSK